MLPNFIKRRLGYTIDPEELYAYRSVIPDTVFVHVDRNTYPYILRISEVDDKKIAKDLLVSQATNEEEVVDVINDMVLMYRNVPEIYRPYFRRVLSPDGAQKKETDLVLVKN